MARTRTSAPSRARLAATTFGRFLLLVVVVAATGVGAGAALGYPLRELDLGGDPAVTLDHTSLKGTFDPSDALVRLEDLPENWAATPPEVSESLVLVGAEYCGQAPELTDPLGEPLRAVFADALNGQLLQAEVVRVRRLADAGRYVNELTDVLEECTDGQFYVVSPDGQRTLVEIRPDRPNPPVNDYVSRSLGLVGEKKIRVITYFQVADVIVALQYAGPPDPPQTLVSDAELMSDVEKQILERVAPAQFSRTAKVPGLTPIPTEAETTTTIDPTAPSPTSSPVITLPPTAPPSPTFDPPKTTTTSRSRSTTTAPR